MLQSLQIDKVANGDANVKQQLVHSFDLTYNSLDEYNGEFFFHQD